MVTITFNCIVKQTTWANILVILFIASKSLVAMKIYM